MDRWLHPFVLSKLCKMLQGLGLLTIVALVRISEKIDCAKYVLRALGIANRAHSGNKQDTEASHGD